MLSKGEDVTVLKEGADERKTVLLESCAFIAKDIIRKRELELLIAAQNQILTAQPKSWRERATGAVESQAKKDAQRAIDEAEKRIVPLDRDIKKLMSFVKLWDEWEADEAEMLAWKRRGCKGALPACVKRNKEKQYAEMMENGGFVVLPLRGRR